jgi:hypothetical protein
MAGNLERSIRKQTEKPLAISGTQLPPTRSICAPLTQIKEAAGGQVELRAMEQDDWLFVLSIAATLMLTAGGLSVLLFGM